MQTIPPFAVTRATLSTLFGSPRLAQRMIAAGWIVRVRQGGPGRESLYDYDSARRAYERIKVGEEPPPLASEQRRSPTP
jgi:hypothetical protein